MIAHVIVSVVAGILFGVLDGLVNANPLARGVLAVFAPIARPSINIVAGVLIDLAYGFVMAALFLLLYASLPGASGLLKGLSFALIAWFFRVVMSAASQWMMFRVPGGAVAHALAAGLGEMPVRGALFGLTLVPAA